MQKNISRLWRSSRTATDTKLSHNQKPSPGESTSTKPSRIIRSIHDATLDHFIRCVVDQDYRCLIVAGEFTEREVMEAWRDVWEGYLDAMKDTKRQHLMKLASQVNVLTTKLNLANLCIMRLELEFNQEVLDELRKLYQLPKNLMWSTPQQKAKSIERLRTLRANIMRQLADRQYEYDQVAPVSKEGGKADRGMFADLIVAVSKHMQFRVDRMTIPLSEFVAMVVDMRAKYDAERKRLQKQKNGR